MAATWTTLALDSHSTVAGLPRGFGLWSLFSQSFDLFTVVLIGGSLVGVALSVRAVLEIRERRVLPPNLTATLKDLARRGRLSELGTEASGSPTFLGQTVAAAIEAPPTARRQAAELVASEQCARLFRVIEPLNMIGTLGPLVGLAGTVWGMILAFTSLGETGGQAGASDLSLGISKALFHTLLGLLLAIPCLVTYGVCRGIADRICNRGMIAAGEIVDRIEAFDAATAAHRATSGSVSDQAGGPTSPSATPSTAPTATRAT